ncbi:hypothetical protein LINGRAHAP2_LOCUS19322 [Linum grandiflorum]
MVEKLDCH